MLEHDFMIRAFVAGLMMAVIAPTIGTFLVVRRYSFLVDTLAHVSLAGLALGMLLSLHPILTGVIVAVGAAVLIERLRGGGALAGDATLAVVLYGSLGLASILLNVAPGSGVQLESLLFGSILTVQAMDLWIIAGLGIITLGTLVVFYRQLFCLVFDEQWALSAGIPAGALNIVLILLAGFSVAVTLRIAGVLLVGALMVIPALIAQGFRRGFLQTIILASVTGVIAVLSGITLSYYLGWPSGGTIVMVLITVFLGGRLFVK